VEKLTAFVVHKLPGFSRNLRTEVVKNCRYFFLDNGIRNALINNFSLLEQRNDIGQLWENYLVMERLKRQEYLKADFQIVNRDNYLEFIT
jgi:uncharacterized protein